MHPLTLIFAWGGSGGGGGGGVAPGIFNLFNKAFIQIKLDSLTLLPYQLYRSTVNFVSRWEIFRHCKVGRQYDLYL